jgi:hypothetical protein
MIKYIVWEQNVIKKYLYLSHNCKVDMKSEEIGQ